MKELYCLTCPAGCLLSVLEFGGEDIEVSGNECERGEDFARTEISNPMRTLTTTVKTKIPGVPVLPVRTNGEIPKVKIMDAIHALSNVIVSSELGCGDIVLDDLVGTGVSVIATSDILTPSRRNIEASQGANSPFSDVLTLGLTNFTSRSEGYVENADKERSEGEEELLEEGEDAEAQENNERSHIRSR